MLYHCLTASSAYIKYHDLRTTSGYLELILEYGPCRCATRSADDALPEGWAVAHDPNGKPYYWHKATQKTQWDKPTA